MPESIEVSIDADRFDEVVHESLSEGGDLEIVVKPGATRAGRPAVAVTFTVGVRGKTRRAQAVTTLRALKSAVESIPDSFQ